MAGPFQESFYKHRTITKGGFSLAHGSGKRWLEVGLFPDYTHTTTSSTHGGLDYN